MSASTSTSTSICVCVCSLLTNNVCHVVICVSSINNFNFIFNGNRDGDGDGDKTTIYLFLWLLLVLFLFLFCCCNYCPWNKLIWQFRENPYRNQTRIIVRIHQYLCCWMKLKRLCLFLLIELWCCCLGGLKSSYIYGSNSIFGTAQ